MEKKIAVGIIMAFATVVPTSGAIARSEAHRPPVATTVAAPAQAAADTHLLPLVGGQNFRDIGGYRTADGRMVRRGEVFRSGAMNLLTPADFDYLASLGLQTVVDFRSTPERTHAPTQWPAGFQPEVIVSVSENLNDPALMGSMRRDGPLTADSARAMMGKLTGQIPVIFADEYRALFAAILADNGAVAFNCSAGKDRTGVAGALLLTILGVPREVVIEDYLLSNQYYKPAAAGNGGHSMLAGISPEARNALMTVDRSYIEAAFETLDNWPGGIDAYYRDKLGLDATKLEQLRTRLLTEAPAKAG